MFSSLESSTRSDDDKVGQMTRRFLDHHGFDSLKSLDLYHHTPLHRVSMTRVDNDLSRHPNYCEESSSFRKAENRARMVRYMFQQQGGWKQLEAKDMHGWTPLHHALSCYTLVTALVQDCGANVNATDACGQTPLHMICRNYFWEEEDHHNDLRVVETLLNHGADIEARDQDGWTPLHRACREGNAFMIPLLLRRGADVACRTRDEGWTPFHILFQGRSGTPTISFHVLSDTIKLLVKYGADINAIDRHGLTPLHHAAIKGHDFVVRGLLAHGANANAVTDTCHMTPIHLACLMDHLSVLQTLLKHPDTDLLVVDNSGDSVLHHAASMRIAQYILESGAQTQYVRDRHTRDAVCASLLFTKNKKGQTPLNAAMERVKEGAEIEYLSKNVQLKKYLESYTSYTVAVGLERHESGVNFNPDLNAFQHRFALQIHDLLSQTAIHQLSFVILGYLSVSDVMKPIIM